MSMVRVAQIVGARPQLVKAAAISRALRDRSELFTEIVIHTGQHYDPLMSDIFFDEHSMPKPQYQLDVGSGSHAAQTALILTRLESVLTEVTPDVVLVPGDTNSALAAALCAAKIGIPVAHLEAGLRSFNRQMPEEINRVVVDHLSDALLCPSETSRANLEREGINRGVHVTGDVMLDAMKFASPPRDEAEQVIARHRLEPQSYAVATIHRAESTDHEQRLTQMVSALERLSDDLPVIVPLHPRTAKILGSAESDRRLRIIPPVGHREMIALLQSARLGLTDSGGLQKELYWLGVPCVTMRSETEWTETVATGWNIVAGYESDSILSAAQTLLSSRPSDHPPIYGTGDAAHRVVTALATTFDGSPEAD